MAKVSTNLGKVATTPKGVYSNETTYVKLDIVTYNGSSYICLKESVGILPTNTEYWQLIASKGDKGNDGYTPVKGVDYFTQEDIESLNIPSELSELSEDTTHRVVTDVEKTTWNNKSDFSGSYNDLTDKPNIPSKTSDLTNDSDFITNSVNNLVNYYLKNEVYTKEEVTQLIGAIQLFHYEVVQELPTTGANNILYLVPKSTSQTNNVYDEYVYSNGWEKIGDTEIDLSNYVTITMLNQALANYTTTANLTTLLNAKQNEITSTNKLDASLVDDSLSNNKFVTSAEKIKLNNLNVYFIENNSQENPFILSKHDVGVYHFNPRNNDEVFSVYFKVKESDPSSTVTTTNYYPNSIFVYNNKIEEEQTFSTMITVGKILNMFVNSLRRTISYGSFDVQIQNTGRINFYNKTYTNNLSFLNLEQTISAKKIFSVLPESSVVPTTDNQLVNKKYVDDGIAGIDLSSKQDVLTAGDNITIDENNVISASGKTHIIYNNSISNPFILEEHDTGIYFFQMNIEASNVIIKAKRSNSSIVSLQNFSNTNFINYYTKVDENITNNTPVFSYANISIGSSSASKTIIQYKYNDTSTSGLQGYNTNFGNGNYVSTSVNSNITAQLSFSTLPKSTITPTTDEHLTNKKYVDDQIGNINTVLASLTTINGGE